LVQHFVAQVCNQNDWKPVTFPPDVIEALQTHSWPGNVRELRNVVERVLLLASNGQVDIATVRLALPRNPSGQPPSSSASGTLAERTENFEREVILGELKRTNYHVTNTAKALGLERSHLYKKAEQLGIDLRSLRQDASAASPLT
jgi:DNA-binding NtrC family response regulator